MTMTNSDARKRLEERNLAATAQSEPDYEYLAAVFRVAWHAADDAGRTGDRVTAGLKAVLGVLEKSR